ncbi:MAG: cytochrome C oxidase subunit IV family protein, partial [Bradyrhizobium sp.]|uniref:cytochrome C oxidase subunit IV family protein n=1 Tax=Bradyrhizobium sp. TaxID=376 RepID=UPI002900944A
VRDRLNVAWRQLLALAIATLAAASLLPSRWLIDAVVLSLAMAKGRVIVLEFLGLRHAPALWRGLLTTWLAGLTMLAGLAVALRAMV